MVRYTAAAELWSCWWAVILIPSVTEEQPSMTAAVDSKSSRGMIDSDTVVFWLMLIGARSSGRFQLQIQLSTASVAALAAAAALYGSVCHVLVRVMLVEC
jgi:hypothetical protein